MSGRCSINHIRHGGVTNAPDASTGRQSLMRTFTGQARVGGWHLPGWSKISD